MSGLFCPNRKKEEGEGKVQILNLIYALRPPRFLFSFFSLFSREYLSIEKKRVGRSTAAQKEEEKEKKEAAK